MNFILGSVVENTVNYRVIFMHNTWKFYIHPKCPLPSSGPPSLANIPFILWMFPTEEQFSIAVAF